MLFVHIVILFFSIIVHEIAHAYVAYVRGDNAKSTLERITLNPMSHVELFGTVIIPVFLLLVKAPIFFGWAKPVTINYNNLKNPKIDIFIISLAGPMSNALISIFSGFVIYFVEVFYDFKLELIKSIVHFFYTILVVNVFLMVINLLPIPPLDGSKIITCFLPKKIKLSLLSLNKHVYLAVLFMLMSFNVVWKLIHHAIFFFVNVFSFNFYKNG
ncbi:MAG: site-2 protease family protein [Endomicrobium sp.]|jgi:Zn-dependent protease|nr:site-2 protease family protein [Endomicrobium sp.]